LVSLIKRLPRNQWRGPIPARLLPRAGENALAQGAAIPIVLGVTERGVSC